MSRKSKAIGFAIYPDDLERIAAQEEPDKAAVLLYGVDAQLDAVAAAVKSLLAEGIAVNALPQGSKIQSGAKIYALTDKGVKEVEPNA